DREHLLELAPIGDVAGLEGAAGREGGARVGVLAEDDHANIGRPDAVEGVEDMGAFRRTGKGAALAGGEYRLPRLQGQRRVDRLETELAAVHCRAPVGI